MRTGTAVLAGSPRRVAAANDKGGLETAGEVDDSCSISFVGLARELSAFTAVLLVAAVDAAALAEAPEAPDAPEVAAAELFEPMGPGTTALRDAGGLATAAIVRGGATAASGLPHTLRL